MDTACSSSLVGAHWALQELLRGGSAASRAAVTAGVGVLLSPDPTAMFQKAGMLAADGRCKTLDATADGYVRGEAVAALVMAVLGTERDGQREQGGAVLAVVRSSAVNQDGRSSSLTAPNGPAQQAVMRAALVAADLQVG